jgi:hypothetical protein
MLVRATGPTSPPKWANMSEGRPSKTTEISVVSQEQAARLLGVEEGRPRFRFWVVIMAATDQFGLSRSALNALIRS